MAYTTPPTFVSGDPLLAAELNVLGDDIVYLAGVAAGVTFSGVKISRGTNQSIADSTAVDISFTTEVLDYGAWWSSGTTITVPAGAIPASYTTIAIAVNATIRYAINGTGARRLYVTKNGSVEETSPSVSALSGENTYASVNTWIEVAAGDTITLQAYQSSGGALNAESIKLAIYRIAPLA